MKWGLSLVFFLALASFVSAQEFNAGFVQGLWYGDEQVFAEKDTRVYVAIRNNTGSDLTGTVEFFDGDKRIERNNVSALDGRIIESWADWTPSYGEHTITATLSRTELHQVGEGTEAVEVVSALAENIIFVDYDTDNDGIGNKDDSDDDGDGISDEEEEENGTDPLVSDNGNEGNEKTEEDDDLEDEDEEDESQDTDNNDDPEGLEQYLTDSTVDSTLSAITDRVNSTKKRIDSYRDDRNQRNGDIAIKEPAIISQIKPVGLDDTSSLLGSPASSTASDTSEFEDGFGEVTRSQSDDKGGFVATILKLLKTLVSSVYTLVLYLVSMYLTHPIIVQLTLLLLILFILVKVAKRLANRNNV